MQGEFRGDFSRDSFDSYKHFSRVLMQQGRVQLDADWNEQTSIVLHYLQALAADLIGPFGGSKNGFKIELNDHKSTFTIGCGHYYVDGILCENEDGMDYYDQPDYPINKNCLLPKDGLFLVYLDVWERHISYIEDDGIREVALQGIDTATRAKIVWQVRITHPLTVFNSENESIEITDKDDLHSHWDKLVQHWQPENRGMLKVRAKQKAATETEPCLISPDMRYQGAENQLYRVEIHQGSKLQEEGCTVQEIPTFKWSRDNGAIALPIIDHAGKILIVAMNGRDLMLGISAEQWIEIIDDRCELLGIPGTLVQVAKVEGQTLTLKDRLDDHKIDLCKHPKARRWDYHALPIQEVTDKNKNWLTLEDGIQIQFQPGATYRTGDYWLIPARTAIGDILWPLDGGNPKALPPHGVEHHYAPLALMSFSSPGDCGDCRTLLVSDKYDKLFSRQAPSELKELS